MSRRFDWLLVGSWLAIMVGCLIVGLGITMLVEWLS